MVEEEEEISIDEFPAFFFLFRYVIYTFRELRIGRGGGGSGGGGGGAALSLNIWKKKERLYPNQEAFAVQQIIASELAQ